MLNLDINVVFEIINIIVLFLLMKKFLFGPVNAIMEKRERLIRQSVEEAEITRNKANELKAEYESRLEDAKSEAASIIKDAKSRGEKEYESRLADAAKEAQKLIKDAEVSAAAEKEKALRGARSEIASLALAAAAKVAQKNTGSAEDKKLIDDFLTEAGEAN